jgi:hypothetical protein
MCLLWDFIIMHLAEERPDHSHVLMYPEIAEFTFQAAKIIIRTAFTSISVHGVASCFTPMYCR